MLKRPLAIGILGLLAGWGSPVVGQGEVVVRYLHNSGWLVQTSNHLLVFDYIGGNPEAEASSPEQGYLKAADLAGRPLTVFVSHRHRDHFSEDVLGWADDIAGARFVYGWPAAEARDSDLVLEGRSEGMAGELAVRSFASTDLGVGFVVEVDGVTILHAGDHARWTADMDEAFMAEIRYLAAEDLEIDLAFFPIATGMACEPRESIRQGVVGALEVLRPRAAFPMHVRCPDQLDLYRDFAERVGDQLPEVRVAYPRRPGEEFTYSGGIIERASN